MLDFWQSRTGRLLRWLLFVPAGFAIATFLEWPPIAIARGIEDIKLTWWTLIILALASVVLLFLAMWWLGLVFLLPKVICRVIAPSPRIAALIFGTFFVTVRMAEVLTDVTLGQFDQGRVLYQLGFLLVFVGGIVRAYIEDPAFDAANEAAIRTSRLRSESQNHAVSLSSPPIAQSNSKLPASTLA